MKDKSLIEKNILLFSKTIFSKTAVIVVVVLAHPSNCRQGYQPAVLYPTLENSQFWGILSEYPFSELCWVGWIVEEVQSYISVLS